MKKQLFIWPHRKIKWANAEIKKLDTAIKKRFSPDSYTVRTKLNSERTEETHEFRTRNIPASMAMQAKNILQNLREPLDGILVEISGQKGGISFPFGDRMEKYTSELEKLEKLLPEGAIDLIKEAKTYPGGNEHLRAMHYYARDQRHRIPMEPIVVETEIDIKAVIVGNGNVIRLGYRHGSHMVPDPSNNLVAAPGHQPFLELNHGVVRMLFRPDPRDEQMEFITVTPGAHVQYDCKPAIDITFGEIPALKGEPVIVTLHQISHLVEGIVLTFERRFFP